MEPEFNYSSVASIVAAAEKSRSSHLCHRTEAAGGTDGADRGISI